MWVSYERVATQPVWQLAKSDWKSEAKQVTQSYTELLLNIEILSPKYKIWRKFYQ